MKKKKKGAHPGSGLRQSPGLMLLSTMYLLVELV